MQKAQKVPIAVIPKPALTIDGNLLNGDFYVETIVLWSGFFSRLQTVTSEKVLKTKHRGFSENCDFNPMVCKLHDSSATRIARLTKTVTTVEHKAICSASLATDKQNASRSGGRELW